MGHCTSKDQKEGKRLNRRIDEQIKKDQSMSLRIIKLLLLVCIGFLSTFDHGTPQKLPLSNSQNLLNVPTSKKERHFRGY
ncbi:unnamed protein product [Nippostrongylus brasiliensis]|uniref:Ovule protein n=1 Tax=Nippostrongylus brasiliensis TaxID=27835 RepID=A0A158QY69_NIPBR|nr:unnamed protein product [Nippostrongylus brasiliensis]